MNNQPSPLNSRFDKWASRHPRQALRQWQQASPARRRSLITDAPAPEWVATDLFGVGVKAVRVYG
jgi:hypothetical protein